MRGEGGVGEAGREGMDGKGRVEGLRITVITGPRVYVLGLTCMQRACQHFD